MNFEKLTLLPAEKKVMHSLKKGSRAFDLDAARSLVRIGLLAQSYSGHSLDRQYSNEFYFSEHGKRYIEYQSEKRKAYWKSVFTNFFSGLAVGILSTLAVTYFTGLLSL